MILWMYDEKQYVVVREEHRVYKIEHTTCKKLLNELCYMYGTTYDGSRHAICRCLHITKNAPILVSFYLNTIFFPINNEEKRNCWVNYTCVEQIKKRNEFQTTLIMRANLSLQVQTSYRSIHRQIQRCKMYLRILDSFNIQDYVDHIYTTQGCAYET